jgi:hypothetical protein
MSEEYEYTALLWSVDNVKPDRFDRLSVGGRFQSRIERHVRHAGQSFVEVWQLRTPTAPATPVEPDYEHVETVGVDSRLLSPELLTSSYTVNHPGVAPSVGRISVPRIIARDREELRRMYDDIAEEYGGLSFDEMTITEVLRSIDGSVGPKSEQ